MGNVPLCLSKRGGIEFGEFTDITKGRFSLKSYHPYYMSFDDLSREGGSKEDGMSGRDSTTILGLEMDQESVCRCTGGNVKHTCMHRMGEASFLTTGKGWRS